MAGVAQTHHGEAVMLCLGDPVINRQRPDGLAEAEIAVHDRVRRGFVHDGQGLARHHLAFLEPLNVARRPDHAVTVVASQVG